MEVRASAPVAVDDPWDAFADDGLGLMAHSYDVPAHPLQTSTEVASLAPNAEITAFPWKEPAKLKETHINRARNFLSRCAPLRNKSNNISARECGILGLNSVALQAK